MDNKSFNKAVGTRVKQQRISQNLTREKLSEMTSISDKFVYDIEVGNKGMSAYTLYRLATALKVTTDSLLYGVRDEPLAPKEN
jgi:transcriptional regulator with XRE-family HTH domain